jgi:hypothetical protein
VFTAVISYPATKKELEEEINVQVFVLYWAGNDPRITQMRLEYITALV